MLQSHLHRCGIALLLCISLVFTGCVEKEEPPLSEEMTITLLVELHLLQGQRDTDVEDIPRREAVFDHYQISEEDLDETLLFYARHPEKYKDLYSKVMDTLQVERDPTRLQEMEDWADPT